MATSLLTRGFLLHQTRRIYLPSSSFRFFSSSKNEGGEDASSQDQTSKEQFNSKHNQTSDASTIEQPVVDNENIATSTTYELSKAEGAVEKFFKIVQKVKESQNERNISEEKEPEATVDEGPNESFATMFRKSKFSALGDIKGRLVQGQIIEVMDDDLYIDFGGKFHCVCPRPKRNPDSYYRGATVVVNLQAMEMSSAFLGSDIHITLLEADGILVGLTNSSRSHSTKLAKQ